MKGQYTIYYDDTCSLCRRFAAWIRRLDRRGVTQLMPVSEGALAAAHAPLSLEACRREIHVVTPQGAVLAGWDAVTALARLFPATFLFGLLGALPGLRHAGQWAYRQVARRRHGLCRAGGGNCGL